MRPRSEKGQKKQDSLPKASVTEDGDDLILSFTVSGGKRPADLTPEQIPPGGQTIEYRQGSEGFARINARIAAGEFTEFPLARALLEYRKKTMVKAFDQAIAQENKRLGVGPGAPGVWGKMLAHAREEARKAGKQLRWNDAFAQLGIPEAERKAARHACKGVEYRLRLAARTVPENKPSVRLFDRPDHPGK